MTLRSSMMVLGLSFLLSLGGCKKDEGAGTGESAAKEAPKKAKGDCKYKSPTGYCLSPPDGFEAKEYTDPVPGTAFKKPDDPKPGQDLFVSILDFEATAQHLKTERDQRKQNAKAVLADIDIADGKGYYVAVETANNVMVSAAVAGNGKTFQCAFNAYLKDKDALKSWIDACKSLRLSD